MPGHFFVVRGDLTRFACDAWLLPTGRSLWIQPQWLRGAPDTLVSRGRSHDGRIGVPRKVLVTRSYDGILETPPGWRERRVRSMMAPASDWPVAAGQPQPWLTQIVVDPAWPARDKARWCADGARAFVESATQALLADPESKPANGRIRHLLALPVVGTGAGGGWEVAGEIVRELVRTLTDVVQTVNVDVVLVTHSGDQLAAVQQARHKLAHDGTVEPWRLLPTALKATGRTLAEHARQGRLVLFLGAGVSVGAGLPTWDQLLARLAERASLDEADKEALTQLPAVDQARIVRNRLERSPDGTVKAGALADAICDLTHADQYGLSHALLANLPVSESVTTNYDTLFEAASGAAGYRTAVLPYASAEGATRWLLKMHGCVDHKQDIVLTREDFLRYADRRGALAGIVQALLITRHMLFVGFSLTDDNFQRIADDVRKVVRLPAASGTSTRHGPFGTALLLSQSHLLPRLWEGDVNCVSMSSSEMPLSTPAAANQLEILLDFVLAQSSTNVSHLLDSRYDGLLSPDEAVLRDILVALQQSATARQGVVNLPAWQPVAEMLRALGGAGSSGQS